MDAMGENDLPGELRDIEQNIDLGAPDHIMMYVDLISRIPKSQYTRQRLNIAEKIFSKANVKRKMVKFGSFNIEPGMNRSSKIKKDIEKKKQAKIVLNMFRGLNEVIRSFAESNQFDQTTKITNQDVSTLNLFSCYMDTLKEMTDNYINEIDRLHNMLFELQHEGKISGAMEEENFRTESLAAKEKTRNEIWDLIQDHENTAGALYQ
jgi:hypothetical protein